MFILTCAIFLQYSTGRSQSLTVDYTIGSFASAVSLSINAAGELLVLDAGVNACVRLRQDGTELSRVQGSGWGNGEFDGPTDVCATFPLAVFVSDDRNKRIQQFDRDLLFVQMIDQMQTTDGQMLAGSFRPIASAQSAQGELFVLDADGTRVVKFTTRFRVEREFGTYSSGSGRLRSPTDLCMTEDGRVAVADGRSIVVYDQFGNYLSSQSGETDDFFRAVSSNEGDIIAVSPAAITILHAAKETVQPAVRIEAGMIVGDVVESLRDAARSTDWWYILTPHKVLVCRRTE